MADVQAERADDAEGSRCNSAGSCNSVDRGRARAATPRIGSDRDMMLK